jgi:Fe2+ transport system protein B
MVFLNILLPVIGYGIAGKESLIFMLFLLFFVDCLAVCEIIANRKKPTQQYGRNANHYLFTDKE